MNEVWVYQMCMLMTVVITSPSRVFADDVIVDVEGQGPVLGTREIFEYNLDPYRLTRYIAVFRGIPFAEPPTSNLRFANPRPKQPWEGVWNATYYRNMCHQVIFSFEQYPEFGIPGQDEDCLHLNIWSPDVEHGPQYPVMFWIHGGAFVLGSALNRIYEGDALAAYNDVVIVTVNYRIGGFGFMSTGDKVIPGNFGLRDQQLALRWVHDHIAAFGGDPDRVTLFGQSAGAASAGFQLTAPDSWPLYNNAILMSGSMNARWAVASDFESVRRKSFQVGQLVGCDVMRDSTQLLRCMRAAPAKELMRAFQVNLFGPIVDFDFIPNYPRILLQRGQFKNCTLMLGTTKDEGDLAASFQFPDQSLEINPYCSKRRFDRILQEFDDLYQTELASDALELQYVDWTQADNESANYFRNFIDIKTDQNFLSPCEELSQAALRNGGVVFRWMFSYVPTYSVYPPIPKWKGSSHADDIELVFGNAFQDQYYSMRPYPEAERALSLDMQRYYTNFAKTGDPNTGGDNDGIEGGESYWHPYTVPEQGIKELNVGLPDIVAYRASFCRFWNHKMPRLTTYSGDMETVYHDWQREYAQWKQDDVKTWTTEKAQCQADLVD